MPKGAETRLAYKVSVTGGELKVVYFGLVASGQVVTAEEAVKRLGAGEVCVFVACRHDVKAKVEALWGERGPHPSPPQKGGDRDGTGLEVSHSHAVGVVGDAGPDR